MDEKERIEKVMLTEGLNSAQFAMEIGIQGSTLSHILNGRNKPSLDVLKKILNRFRTLSSDWLILGISPMYRSERNSQTPTLFDSIDVTIDKSVTNNDKLPLNSATDFQSIQEKTTNFSEINTNSIVEHSNFAKEQNTNSKSVRKIIVYYSDNTFQEFESK